MLDGATCLTTSGFHALWPCLNLIDSQGFFKMTHSLNPTVNPEFTFQMTNTQTISTVFVLNRESAFGSLRIRLSEVSIGFDTTNYLLNSSCND